MTLPKLRSRPTSTQSCANFGGVLHKPTAPVGTWYDERNLCSDKSPTACARPVRTLAANIDGNVPVAPIVSMCGGDRLVLLDEDSNWYCGGHSLNSYDPVHPEFEPWLSWKITVDKGFMGDDPANVTVTPESGSDQSWAALNHLGLTQVGEDWTISQSVVSFWLPEDTVEGVWKNDLGHQGIFQNGAPPSDYGITVTADNYMDGVIIRVWQWEENHQALGEGHRLIRMGANVIDAKAGTWVNAVKLASGDEMTEGTDYGTLGLDETIAYEEITLTLCDIDGVPYSGVVVSATEPMTQEGYWLDTSGTEPVLREWVAYQNMWITLTSTYVRIRVEETGVSWASGVKVGDTVHISADCPEGTDPGVVQLLDSWHHIYNAVEENGIRDLIVVGVLPADEVTVIGDGDLTAIVTSRPIPAMDFVVEAQNRLWGCRYDEAQGINEIYASALGDPTNWHVFQGLSTDSWTASRGTAAPFTGAAVLDGYPLFFREESLEKVYPSSVGAHQIQTFDLYGVEKGASDSLCVIEDRLYYKSRHGVCVYTGTLPRVISDAFGDMEFEGGSAARHQRKYCLATRMKSPQDEDVVLVYDTVTGDWHIEDEAWEGAAVTWRDEMYYLREGSIYTMATGTVYGLAKWYAETAPQAISYYSGKSRQSLTEHKWVSYFRIRFRMLANGTRQQNKLRIYISYEDGPWQLKKEFSGGTSVLRTWEIAFLPRRMDNFRIRLEGEGPTQIYDMAWRVERSQGGH